MIKFTFSFIFLFFMSLGFKTWAFDLPKIDGPVVDQVGLLSSQAKNQLSQLLFQARENNGPQVQVLVVSSLQGLTIEEVAIKVFDGWKLGDIKLDNGVLFLIAPNEKKLRIEVGRGLEGDIPDITAKRIVSDVVRPYFKRGEFNAGIMQGTQAILHYAKAKVTLSGEAAVDDQVQEGQRKQSSPWIFIVIFIIWLIIFITNPSLALSILFLATRGGGGGRSGGGSWSGGGGSSAGGGASGDW